MKLAEQEEARRLRREEGLSISEIASRLEVAPSSVSRWSRDICLTESQVARLMLSNPIYNRQLAASKRVKERFQNLRRRYQESGRQKARTEDGLHLDGCMLYWAEGSKSRNVLSIVNSDPRLIAFFLRFLKHCYGVEDGEITVHINCFDDCHSVAAIEDFWLHELQLPRECLRKTTVNRHSISSQQKRCKKLAYGTCKLNLCRTDILHSIYGAIQEYAGVEVDTWLD